MAFLCADKSVLGRHKKVPADLYDCAKLFPAQHQHQNLPANIIKDWVWKSNFTVRSVGLFSKFWLKCVNSATIYNRDVLVKALNERPVGVPLITVTNHHSCMDEPLIMGILDIGQLLNPSLMRWALAAHDICFTNRFHSIFFAYGKSIPIVRGDGVYQSGMSFALDRLNEGNWLHMYPEGKVNDTKQDMRLKWGVGRLIAECKVTPIVVPIYHVGMDSILPNRKPYIPRVGQKVTVLVGNPIPVKQELDRLNQRGASDEEKRKVLTDLVQKHLHQMRVDTEIYHAKHTYRHDKYLV